METGVVPAAMLNWAVFAGKSRFGISPTPVGFCRAALDDALASAAACGEDSAGLGEVRCGQRSYCRSVPAQAARAANASSESPH